MRRAVWAAVYGFAALCACSGQTEGGDTADGGDAGGTGGKGASAPAKCERYASTWCKRAFGCYVEVGRLQASALRQNVDQCYRLISERLPCAEITTIGPNYEACLAQMTRMACSSWDVPPNEFGTVTPPSSCSDVLAF